MSTTNALRPLLAVCSSVIAFALLIERAGFPLAVLFTVLIGSTATPRPRRGEALLLAVILATVMTIVFVAILDQPFTLVP
jgi:hypothetical protein